MNSSQLGQILCVLTGQGGLTLAIGDAILWAYTASLISFPVEDRSCPSPGFCLHPHQKGILGGSRVLDPATFL